MLNRAVGDSRIQPREQRECSGGTERGRAATYLVLSHCEESLGCAESHKYSWSLHNLH